MAVSPFFVLLAVSLSLRPAFAQEGKDQLAISARHIVNCIQHAVTVRQEKQFLLFQCESNFAEALFEALAASTDVVETEASVGEQRELMHVRTREFYRSDNQASLCRQSYRESDSQLFNECHILVYGGQFLESGR